MVREKTVSDKTKANKKVTRFTYYGIKEPRTPETAHTPLLPTEQQVMMLLMVNDWSKAIIAGKQAAGDERLVIDMTPATKPGLLWTGKRNQGKVLVLQEAGFPDLKADYILANPPFNMKRRGGEHLREDKRWRFGVPPVGNANFAWVQHMIHHLAPVGLAGVVLANGSLSTTKAELAIRKGIIEDDLVDCMVALPGQLFYSTQIPACLWFLARDKKNGPACAAPGAARRRFRHRRGQVLFIDARKMGQMWIAPTASSPTRTSATSPIPTTPGARTAMPASTRTPPVLQERHAGGNPQARLRAHAGPLRRRRAVRGKDAATGGAATRAAGRGREARCGDCQEPEGAGL